MEDSFAHLGNREVWDGQMPFGLSTSDRRQHTYVVGKTGTGKSTLLRNLILSDIEAGRGVGVIDPHGDLALDILDHFPPRRADDLVYFNPTDLDHPVAFNLLAAMQRANVPVESRTPFYLHIDEFQNFTSDSFASILSESRKWGLAMTLLNQHISQLRPETAAAVFGNVGNLISFRVGESDAAIMAREYGRAFVPETFTDLPNHHVLVRNLSKNLISDPFRATTLPPSGVRYGRRVKLIARSRERFTTPRALVERRISQWLDPKRT